MKKIIMTLALMGVATSLSACGFGQIDQGEEGVKVSLGKVKDTSVEPGWYFTGLTESMYEYNNRSQKYDSTTMTYTKDLQQANIDYTLKYNLQKGHAGEVYQAVRSSWEQPLVLDFVNDSLKNVLGKFEAVQLVQNRDQASPLILKALQERINENLVKIGIKPDTIQVSAFTVNNVDFSDEFEKAVETKVTAIQNAEAEKNRSAQVEEQARQTVLKAEAEARAMQIKSDALSKNQNLVSYEAVQKWDGKLPVNMYGGAPVPFIKIDN